MIVLGIESTAHTFGCGIVSGKKGECKILANEKASFVTEEGGIHPSKAADHHFENAEEVVKRAVETAGIKSKEIEAVAFSQGPGLGPCLKVGAVTARAISLALDKPLIGVNHCIAHVEIGKALTNSKNPIVCYASGANTQIIGFENGRYRVYGETLDTGIGNLLDTYGRSQGIGFPAGPVLDEMYFKGKKLVELPYSVKGMDLVFSGLLTAAKNKAKTEKKEDMAYSLLHNAFAMLTEITERALAHTEKKEVLLTGGVAASKALQQMMTKMCEERNAECFVPERSVCVDNAAMIAWLGLVMRENKLETSLGESIVLPKQRTDDVDAVWVKYADFAK